jgi:hypothetical protein
VSAMPHFQQNLGRNSVTPTASPSCPPGSFKKRMSHYWMKLKECSKCQTSYASYKNV